MSLPGVRPYSQENKAHTSAKLSVRIGRRLGDAIPVELADLADCRKRSLRWVLCEDGLEHAFCESCGEEIMGHHRIKDAAILQKTVNKAISDAMAEPVPELIPLVKPKRKWKLKWGK